MATNPLLEQAARERAERTGQADRAEQKQDNARERGAAFGDTFAAGAAAKAAKKDKEWKENRRSISVWIHQDQHKALNQMRLDTGLSVRRLIEEAVNELLKSKGKEAVDIGDPKPFGD